MPATPKDLALMAIAFKAGFLAREKYNETLDTRYPEDQKIMEMELKKFLEEEA